VSNGGSRFSFQHVLLSLNQSTSIKSQKPSKGKGKLKGKVQPRTGHEGPEKKVEV